MFVEEYAGLQEAEKLELHEVMLSEIAEGFMYPTLIVGPHKELLPKSVHMIAFFRPAGGSDVYAFQGQAHWYDHLRVHVPLYARDSELMAPDHRLCPLLCEAQLLTASLAAEASVDVVAKLKGRAEVAPVRSRNLCDFEPKWLNAIHNYLVVYGHQRAISDDPHHRTVCFMGRRYVRHESITIGDLIVNITK